MTWIESMREAIQYMEENLEEDLKVEDVAKHIFLSPFYFQKAFRLLCGFTVGEYIRNRRLTAAGNDLLTTNKKIIDIAMKYGYDSPDSFTKAFTRFHGATPTAVRKGGQTLKAFAPLKLIFSLEGGSIMDYKIVEKEAFQVIGISKRFHADTSLKEIPAFWAEHCQSGNWKYIYGTYGVCMETNETGQEFEYMIADDYDVNKHLPEEFRVFTIPKHTWVVFPCVGPMPKALQDINAKVFSEWLPNCTDYEIAGGYNIEYYADPKKYEKGLQDEKYYSECWFPIKKR